MANDARLVELEPKERTDVLLRLLEINREEIREWQQTLFQVSLWFNGGIVAIAAVVHDREFQRSVAIDLLISLAIVCLGLFYFVFSGVARSAIELTGLDLLKFQKALRLDQADYYLPGTSIYQPTGTWLPQEHVTSLRALNVAVCVLAMLSLVVKYFP